MNNFLKNTVLFTSSVSALLSFNKIGFGTNTSDSFFTATEEDTFDEPMYLDSFFQYEELGEETSNFLDLDIDPVLILNSDESYADEFSKIKQLVCDVYSGSLSEKAFIIEFIDLLNNTFFDQAIQSFISNENIEAEYKQYFLDLVLSSDIDIFVSWYKKALVQASKSKDESLAFFGKDVLELYEDEFNKITIQA